MEQFVTADPSQASSHGNHTELLDSFRYLHPEREKAYTCWSTLLDSRKINYGTRIDYILISKSVTDLLKEAEVWQQVEGSDHCPVFAELDVSFVPSPTLPSLCSKYFSAGRQRKLFDFVSQKTKSGDSTAAVGGAVMLPGKRSGSTTDAPRPAKVRKLESEERPAPEVDSRLQSTKSVQKKLEMSRDVQTAAVDCSEEKVDSTTGDLDQSSQGSAVESSQGETSGDKTGRKLSQAWLGVFGGPPKPPLCKGHNEPCVLRTVKKQGPNKNRQFWVCARPGGGKGDPEARCDFFQWRNSKRK